MALARRAGPAAAPAAAAAAALPQDTGLRPHSISPTGAAWARLWGATTRPHIRLAVHEQGFGAPLARPVRVEVQQQADEQRLPRAPYCSSPPKRSRQGESGNALGSASGAPVRHKRFAPHRHHNTRSCHRRGAAPNSTGLQICLAAGSHCAVWPCVSCVAACIHPLLRLCRGKLQAATAGSPSSLRSSSCPGLAAAPARSRPKAAC